MQDRKTWLTQLGHGQTIDVDEAIHWLGDTIPWLYRYSQTEQDPIWHSEGNVHIHTDMVLEQLYVLFEKEASYLDETQRQALVLGALLHDIAKTKTTKRKEIQGIERVVAPKHEDNGRSYLAYRLIDLELPISQVHRVMGLVGEHHMPKLLVVKNGDRGAYWRLSRKADTELLYWLEVADMRGRICPDQKTQLSYLDEFRLFCEEYGVWGKTYEFALKEALLPLLENCSSKEKKYTYAHAIHAFERDEIFVIEEAIAKAYANRVAHPELVIVCGPSGSGKSSWISENVQKYQLISLDEIRREINGNRADQSNFGKIVSKDLKKYRDELIISSKAGYDMWEGPYGEWGSKKHIIASCDQSLKRMKVDYFDIFYSHRFDPNTPLEETADALETIYKSGKALYIGISSYSSKKTNQIYKILKSRNIKLFIHQPSYSLINRWIEKDLTKTIRKLKIGCIAFSPLAQGMLSDKYLKKIPKVSRASDTTSYLDKSLITKKNLKIVSDLNKIAIKRGQSLSQMAISWVLSNNYVTSALIGVRNINQLKENLESLKKLSFAASEMKIINKTAKDGNINIWKQSSSY